MNKTYFYYIRLFSATYYDIVITDVSMSPLHLLLSTSLIVLRISVSSSRFKLFTGGRFKVNVAIPVLSFTSSLVSSAEDKDRTADQQFFGINVEAVKRTERIIFMMYDNTTWRSS